MISSKSNLLEVKMAERKFFHTEDDLRKAYEELKSLDKVAERFGVSKKLILNYMKRFGISRTTPKKITPYQLGKMKKLAESGFSAIHVAEKTGYSVQRIYILAKKHGIKITDDFHKGYIITHNGYKMLLCPDHPYADGKGYVREHRFVVEEYLGRLLDDFEKVHHCNEDKLDNELENLDITSLAIHTSNHHTGKKGRGPARKK